MTDKTNTTLRPRQSIIELKSVVLYLDKTEHIGKRTAPVTNIQKRPREPNVRVKLREKANHERDIEYEK